MNPLGLVVLGIGLLLIVIGYKGSQSSALTALKGVSTSAKGK